MRCLASSYPLSHPPPSSWSLTDALIMQSPRSYTCSALGAVAAPGIPFGQPCLKLPVLTSSRKQRPQGRGRMCVWFGPVPRPPAQSPAGADSMSDWFAGVAHHATPSGRAIVDHTKDGSQQGRGRGPGQRSGQRSGRRDAWCSNALSASRATHCPCHS